MSKSVSSLPASGSTSSELAAYSNDQRTDRDPGGTEGGDDRQAEEIAAQRMDDVAEDDSRFVGLHANVALDPPPDRRAVLDQEERGEP